MSTHDPQHDDRLFHQIAEWMESPLMPGKEAALQQWLSADPDHQSQIDRWRRLAADARRLRIVAPDYHSSWERLRESIGLRRMQEGKRSRQHRPRIEKVEFYRRPLVAAVLAMLLLSAFLWLLFFVRTRIGF